MARTKTATATDDANGPHPRPLISAASVLGTAPARALSRRLASLCECGIEESACIRESQDDGDDQRHQERIENGVSPDTSDDGLTWAELKAGW